MINGHIQFVTKYVPYVGGGEIMFLKTAEHLRRLGIDVETVPVSQRGIPRLVHFIGSQATLFHEFARDLKYHYRIPYVVTPMFFPVPRKAHHRFISSISQLFIKYRLEMLIPRPGFRKLPFLYKNADLLLPNTRAEADLIKRFFPFITEDKIQIVPNGVDEQFAEAKPDLFRKHFNIDYDFVLNVARLEPRKNQLSLIQALKETDFKLIIIGNQSVFPEYAKSCFIKGQKNVLFINELSHNDPLLASAYAAAKVFALPSEQETPGISALEAAVAGSSVVVTQYGGAQEYLHNFARYVQPGSVSDIRDKVLSAWEDNTDKEKQKLYVLSNYSWTKVAEITLNAYQSVLKKYS